MSNDKGFRSMSALVEALRKAEEGLRGGTLPLPALDDATVDARDLYERLIVLRHKAREAAHARVKTDAPPAAIPSSAPAASAAPAMKPANEANHEERPLPVTTASPAAVTAKAVDAARAEKAAPEAPIRLNTSPSQPAPAPKKEGSSSVKTAAEYLREAQVAMAPAAESVAEKLERARISDLSKAISLSDKFWFTKELFAGDAKAYEVGVSLLNSAKDLREARSFLNEELVAKLKTPPDPEALGAFVELIERRFA